MNRFPHNLYSLIRFGEGAMVISVVLLLLLALGIPALTEAMPFAAQVGSTPGRADTVTPTPTTDATVTATVTNTPIVIDGAGTATATAASAETAEALAGATSTTVGERATLTAVAGRSTQAVLNDRNTQTAVAIVTGTAEALRYAATVEQQNTATAIASLTAVAEKTRVYEATVTAEAANIVPSPSLAPSPQPSFTPEPSATPISSPTEAPGVITSEGSTKPHGGPSIPLVVVVGMGVLAAVAVVAFFVVSRRRKQPAPALTRPTPLPTPVDEQPQGSLLTPHRPEASIPYLESRNRPAGILYCPLSKQALRVGRSADNDLMIDDSFAGWQTVSRHHATVEYDGTRVVVVAAESPNGVLVQGRRTGVNVVRDGWTVSFGQVEFILRENRKGGA